MSNETAIANLLYRYADYIDAGDLAGAAALFAHAEVKSPTSETLLDSDGLLKLWEKLIIMYPDGSPRTKHVITNPIIELDEAAGSARCRSYYTVLQSAQGFPLQIIAAGRYLDRFERVDGAWRFSYRDYTALDMTGDLSRHIRNPSDIGR